MTPAPYSEDALVQKTLEEIGLLQGLKVGREVYFMNMPLLAVLKE